MHIIPTALEGAFIIELEKFVDHRGYFFESFNLKKFQELTGLDTVFVQDNQAFSHQNVVRGLHFQYPPHAQTKLVSVIKGKIIDVIVDMRKGSETFGQSLSVELSEENNRQLFVPKGFAHGYSVISAEGAIISYKCDDYYHPESESGIDLKDVELNIDWQVNPEDMIISTKDLLWEKLSQQTRFF